MKALTIVISLFTSLFLVSCQSSSPTPESLSAVPLKPLPSWTKSKAKASQNSQRVKIETKLFEVTYLPGAKNIPTKRSQKHLNKNQLQSFMRTFTVEKETDILTAPPMVIREMEIGKIEISNEFVYPLPGKTKKYKTENLGVTGIFRVHPFRSGKKITLNTLVQVKDFIGSETGKSDPAQPVFRERRFDEVASLTSGNSILFRGLVSDQQQEIVDGTSFLSDIPLVGNLFTKEYTANVKTELMLLVTATKVEPSSKLN